jgi:hypothetical protein
MKIQGYNIQQSVKEAEKLAATNTRQLPTFFPRVSLPKPIARWPTIRGPPADLSQLRIGGGQLESVKEALASLQDLNKDSIIIMQDLTRYEFCSYCDPVKEHSIRPKTQVTDPMPSFTKALQHHDLTSLYAINVYMTFLLQK